MELVKIYFLIFIIYSMTGWLLEVISTYPDTKCFVNRGFMIGQIGRASCRERV